MSSGRYYVQAMMLLATRLEEDGQSRAAAAVMLAIDELEGTDD